MDWNILISPFKEICNGFLVLVRDKLHSYFSRYLSVLVLLIILAQRNISDDFHYDRKYINWKIFVINSVDFEAKKYQQKLFCYQLKFFNEWFFKTNFIILIKDKCTALLGSFIRVVFQRVIKKKTLFIGSKFTFSQPVLNNIHPIVGQCSRKLPLNLFIGPYFTLHINFDGKINIFNWHHFNNYLYIYMIGKFGWSKHAFTEYWFYM